MNKVYTRIDWENYPSVNTPINERNLNKMDFAVDELDNRIISQDTTKANKTELNSLISDWSMDETTGIITITKVSGEQIIFDLNIEKIPVSFVLSEDGILTMITDDGTAFTANIGAMIPVLTFKDSDEIAVTVTGTGVNKTYSFSIKTGSITEDMLETGYLSNIKVEVAKAESAAGEAQSSETLSDYNAKLSQSYAIGLSGVREGEDTDNAMYYAEQAENSATSASTSEANASASANTATERATEASNSASAAATSETNASTSANTASTKATEAANSASNASESANTATTQASNASASATNAANSATEAESYAHGGTATRENEEIDNAKYYYQQAKSISESFSGALRPMGTVEFANLPAIANVVEGDMYNISDQFTTTTDFKEDSGLTIPAGSNVYKTSDGKWDVLAGSPVTGVKGNAESGYRKGNVNITPDNIGLGNVPNVATNDQTPTFTQASTRANIASGEKLSVIFGKIMKFFADLKTVAFSGSYNDLSNKPTIPAAVAVKGNAESSYRTGNVNLTPANLGALATNGDSKSNTVTFTSNDVADGSATSWTSVTALSSGITHATFFQRVSQMFKNVRYLYKMLGTTDISAIGDGTVSGAISSLNSNLVNVPNYYCAFSKELSFTDGVCNITLDFTPKVTIENIPITIINNTTCQGTMFIYAGSTSAKLLIWENSGQPSITTWIRVGFWCIV